MAYNYDALYDSTPNALGDPSQVFIDFFNQHSTKPLRVLDVGCGQGRDALSIARLGHAVVGVDLSPSGIRDLKAAALAEHLDITGIVADLTSFAPDGLFDVILCDRTLHMLPEALRHEVLKRLIASVQDGGWVLISDEKSNIAGIKDVFDSNPQIWSQEMEHKGQLFMRCS